MNARWMIAAAALVLGAAGVQAQGAPGGARGEGGPGGRGGFGGPALAERLEAENPVALVLEHSHDLGLSSAQTTQISAIKQRLNNQSRPIVARLDSLRPQGGPPPRVDPSSLTAAQRDSMMTRRRAMGQAMGQIRDLQQSAKAETWAVLTADQQKKADDMLEKMRSAQRDRGERGPGGPGGRGGMGGGRGGMGGMGGGMGGGQPPE